MDEKVVEVDVDIVGVEVDVVEVEVFVKKWLKLDVVP